MKHLINRGRRILQEEGPKALLVAGGAHLYNRGIFRLVLEGRAQWYRLRGEAGISNPYEPLWISPYEIEKAYDGCFNQKYRLGEIKEGDWDQNTRQLSEHPAFRGLTERFQNGRPWEKTEYYQELIDRVHKGETVMGCRSVKDVEHRLAYIDRLYEKIKENGYRTQQELSEADWDSHRHPVVTPAHEKTGEIGVNIARDGTFLQNDGIHRLAISRLLDIEKIPVQVVVRHRNWQETRNAAYRKEREALRPAHNNHPDLSVSRK